MRFVDDCLQSSVGEPIESEPVDRGSYLHFKIVLQPTELIESPDSNYQLNESGEDD